MFRRLFAIGLITTLSYGVSRDLTVWASPTLSPEANALKKKTNKLRGNMPIAQVVKIMGQPLKKMPIDRYIWAGSNYTLKLWLRPRGKELNFLETESYSTLGKGDRALEEIGQKVGNFEEGTPYEKIVKQLGSSGKKDDKMTIIKYFWRTKESVAIVVFQNGKIFTYNYFDTPKDYFNRDRLPAD
jgi:hypothetical protein